MPAVPEQVDRSVEQGVDELARSQRLGLDTERRPRLGRERDRLRRPREDAAAGRDQRRVVVRPGGARQLEEPLALGEARRRVRIRIEEDVPVVERADQLDVTGEQHAVAEHVAGHVANPDNGEVGGLDVGPQLAEVALDRLPGAAGRDRHLLVVVAGGAAGGERIAEPEAVLDRDCVRDVREGRRALVGGDDEVRVVLVVANDLRRRHDLAAGDRVGHVEQAAHERLVALDDLLEQRSAVATGRRALDDEAALGADRDDHGVLDRLGLHQPEHLGAEVLAAVGPADASARDPPAAEVHRLDARRVDEDLEHRPRLGQVRHQVGIQLEREVRLRLAAGVRLEVVRPQDCPDDAQEAAQDPILVEALDRIDRALQRRARVPAPSRRCPRTAPGRAEAGRARRAGARRRGAQRARPPCSSG